MMAEWETDRRTLIRQDLERALRSAIPRTGHNDPEEDARGLALAIEKYLDARLSMCTITIHEDRA